MCTALGTRTYKCLCTELGMQIAGYFLFDGYLPPKHIDILFISKEYRYFSKIGKLLCALLISDWPFSLISPSTFHIFQSWSSQMPYGNLWVMQRSLRIFPHRRPLALLHAYIGWSVFCFGIQHETNKLNKMQINFGHNLIRIVVRVPCFMKKFVGVKRVDTICF